MDDFKPNKSTSKYAIKKVNKKFYNTLNVSTDCVTSDKMEYNKNMIYWDTKQFGDMIASSMSDYKHRPTSFGLYKEIPDFLVVFEYEGESIYIDYGDEK